VCDDEGCVMGGRNECVFSWRTLRRRSKMFLVAGVGEIPPPYFRPRLRRPRRSPCYSPPVSVRFPTSLAVSPAFWQMRVALLVPI
jgi:hypothetical protein